MRNKLLYPLLLVLALPAGVLGQGSRYLQFDFNNDLETMLKQQLGRSADIEGLLNAFRTLPPNLLKGFDIDPDSLQLKPDGSGITTTDPMLRDKLERLLKDLNVNLSPEDRKAAEQAAERIRAKATPPKNVAPKAEPKNQPQFKPVPPPPLEKEEKLNRMTRDLMKDVEQSRLGDVLRNSRAWQRGLEELQRGTMSSGKGMDLSFLEKWTGRLRLPDGLKLEISDSLLGKLRNLTAPSLPRMNVNLPGLGGFKSIPSINFPGVPGPGNIPWEGVLVAGVILAAGALLWQLLVRTPKRGAQSGPGWRLGPWPVSPGKISNPAEFIRAFEYLALLRLGLPARNWHHRRIAEGLEQEAEGLAAPARRLMHLYEEARYAPMTAWSDAALITARRDLCLLAGVPAA